MLSSSLLHQTLFLGQPTHQRGAARDASKTGVRYRRERAPQCKKHKSVTGGGTRHTQDTVHACQPCAAQPCAAQPRATRHIPFGGGGADRAHQICYHPQTVRCYLVRLRRHADQRAPRRGGKEGKEGAGGRYLNSIYWYVTNKN